MTQNDKNVPIVGRDNLEVRVYVFTHLETRKKVPNLKMFTSKAKLQLSDTLT